jgi:hypothetical protein
MTQTSDEKLRERCEMLSELMEKNNVDWTDAIYDFARVLIQEMERETLKNTLKVMEEFRKCRPMTSGGDLIAQELIITVREIASKGRG